MINILDKKFIKIISGVLVVTFLAQDIVFANPDMFEIRPAVSTLGVPSFFDPQFIESAVQTRLAIMRTLLRNIEDFPERQLLEIGDIKFGFVRNKAQEKAGVITGTCWLLEHKGRRLPKAQQIIYEVIIPPGEGNIELRRKGAPVTPKTPKNIWKNQKPQLVTTEFVERVEEAAKTLDQIGAIIETPLEKMPLFSNLIGKRAGKEMLIFRKKESTQPAGSFKARGVSYQVFRAIEKRIKDMETDPSLRNKPFYLVTQTTGNHGRALIRAVRLSIEYFLKEYGTEANRAKYPGFVDGIKIIEPIMFSAKVPTLPEYKYNAMRDELIEYQKIVGDSKNEKEYIYAESADYDAADIKRIEFINEHPGDAVYMDHGGAMIREGHGTAGLEIDRQLRKAGIDDSKKVIFVTAIALGGPIGMIEALKGRRRNAEGVIVQTDKYPSFVWSLQTGKLEDNPPNPGPTIVINGVPRVFEDGIAAGKPDQEAVDSAEKHVDYGLVEKDRKNLDKAAPILYKDFRKADGENATVSGTTSLSALAVLEHPEIFDGADAIVILDTESNVDPDIQEYIRARATPPQAKPKPAKPPEGAAIEAHKTEHALWIGVISGLILVPLSLYNADYLMLFTGLAYVLFMTILPIWTARYIRYALSLGTSRRPGKSKTYGLIKAFAKEEVKDLEESWNDIKLRHPEAKGKIAYIVYKPESIKGLYINKEAMKYVPPLYQWIIWVHEILVHRLINIRIEITAIVATYSVPWSALNSVLLTAASLSGCGPDYIVFLTLLLASNLILLPAATGLFAILYGVRETDAGYKELHSGWKSLNDSMIDEIISNHAHTKTWKLAIDTASGAILHRVNYWRNWLRGSQNENQDIAEYAAKINASDISKQMLLNALGDNPELDDPAIRFNRLAHRLGLSDFHSYKDMNGLEGAIDKEVLDGKHLAEIKPILLGLYIDLEFNRVMNRVGLDNFRTYRNTNELKDALDSLVASDEKKLVGEKSHLLNLYKLAKNAGISSMEEPEFKDRVIKWLALADYQDRLGLIKNKINIDRCSDAEALQKEIIKEANKKERIEVITCPEHPDKGIIVAKASLRSREEKPGREIPKETETDFDELMGALLKANIKHPKKEFTLIIADNGPDGASREERRKRVQDIINEVKRAIDVALPRAMLSRTDIRSTEYDITKLRNNLIPFYKARLWRIKHGMVEPEAILCETHGQVERMKNAAIEWLKRNDYADVYFMGDILGRKGAGANRGIDALDVLRDHITSGSRPIPKIIMGYTELLFLMAMMGHEQASNLWVTETGVFGGPAVMDSLRRILSSQPAKPNSVFAGIEKAAATDFTLQLASIANRRYRELKALDEFLGSISLEAKGLTTIEELRKFLKENAYNNKYSAKEANNILNVAISGDATDVKVAFTKLNQLVKAELDEGVRGKYRNLWASWYRFHPKLLDMLNFFIENVKFVHDVDKHHNLHVILGKGYVYEHYGLEGIDALESIESEFREQLRRGLRLLIILKEIWNILNAADEKGRIDTTRVEDSIRKARDLIAHERQVGAELREKGVELVSSQILEHIDKILSMADVSQLPELDELFDSLFSTVKETMQPIHPIFESMLSMTPADTTRPEDLPENFMTMWALNTLMDLSSFTKYKGITSKDIQNLEWLRVTDRKGNVMLIRVDALNKKFKTSEDALAAAKKGDDPDVILILIGSREDLKELRKNKELKGRPREKKRTLEKVTRDKLATAEKILDDYESLIGAKRWYSGLLEFVKESIRDFTRVHPLLAAFLIPPFFMGAVELGPASGPASGPKSLAQHSPFEDGVLRASSQTGLRPFGTPKEEARRAAEAAAKSAIVNRAKNVALPNGKSYDILLTKDVFDTNNGLLFEEIEKILEKTKNRKVFFAVDEGIGEERIAALKNYIKAMGIGPEIMTVSGGERVKDGFLGFYYVLKMIYRMLRAGLDKKSPVVLIGGGAMLDMAGLAASIFHRGMPQIKIPTTLLAQDDAGIGVKNGINFAGYKNLLGTLKVPKSVIIDLVFLKTATPKMISDGLAEIIKVTLLKHKKGFELLEKEIEDPLRNVEELIWVSIDNHTEQIKLDPEEDELARPLDYGHEWAHRLEKITGYRLSHGQAVAIGMAIDSYISCFGEHNGKRRNYITEDEFNRIISIIRKAGLPIYDKAATFKNLWPGLEGFRQHLGGDLTISLLDGIGNKQDVHEIKEDELRAALRFLKSYQPPAPAVKQLAQWSPFDDMSITTSGGYNLGTPEDEAKRAAKAMNEARRKAREAAEAHYTYHSFAKALKAFRKGNISWKRTTTPEIQLEFVKMLARALGKEPGELTTKNFNIPIPQFNNKRLAGLLQYYSDNAQSSTAALKRLKRALGIEDTTASKYQNFAEALKAFRKGNISWKRTTTPEIQLEFVKMLARALGKEPGELTTKNFNIPIPQFNNKRLAGLLQYYSDNAQSSTAALKRLKRALGIEDTTASKYQNFAEALKAFRKGNISWKRTTTPEIQLEFVKMLARALGKEPGELTTKNFNIPIPQFNNKRLAGLLQYYSDNAQSSTAALKRLKRALGIEDTTASKYQNFAEALKAFRKGNISWKRTTTPEIQLEFVKMLAGALGKEPGELNTGDFSRPIPQFGNKYLYGLLQYRGRGTASKALKILKKALGIKDLLKPKKRWKAKYESWDYVISIIKDITGVNVPRHDIRAFLGGLQLSKELDLALAREVQEGNSAAREAMVIIHRKMVMLHVKRYHAKNPDISEDEFEETGMVALQRSVERFDSKRNLSFSTLAWPSIYYSMMDLLRNKRGTRRKGKVKEVQYFETSEEGHTGYMANVEARDAGGPSPKIAPELLVPSTKTIKRILEGKVKPKSEKIEIFLSFIRGTEKQWEIAGRIGKSRSRISQIVIECRKIIRAQLPNLGQPDGKEDTPHLEWPIIIAGPVLAFLFILPFVLAGWVPAPIAVIATIVSTAQAIKSHEDAHLNFGGKLHIGVRGMFVENESGAPQTAEQARAGIVKSAKGAGLQLLLATTAFILSVSGLLPASANEYLNWTAAIFGIGTVINFIYFFASAFFGRDGLLARGITMQQQDAGSVTPAAPKTDPMSEYHYLACSSNLANRLPAQAFAERLRARGENEEIFYVYHLSGTPVVDGMIVVRRGSLEVSGSRLKGVIVDTEALERKQKLNIALRADELLGQKPDKYIFIRKQNFNRYTLARLYDYHVLESNDNNDWVVLERENRSVFPFSREKYRAFMKIFRRDKLYKWTTISDFFSAGIGGVLTAVMMPQILHMAQSKFGILAVTMLALTLVNSGISLFAQAIAGRRASSMEGLLAKTEAAKQRGGGLVQGAKEEVNMRMRRWCGGWWPMLVIAQRACFILIYPMFFESFFGGYSLATRAALFFGIYLVWHFFISITQPAEDRNSYLIGEKAAARGSFKEPGKEALTENFWRARAFSGNVNNVIMLVTLLSTLAVMNLCGIGPITSALFWAIFIPIGLVFKPLTRILALIYGEDAKARLVIYSDRPFNKKAYYNDQGLCKYKFAFEDIGITVSSGNPYFKPERMRDYRLRNLYGMPLRLAETLDRILSTPFFVNLVQQSVLYVDEPYIIVDPQELGIKVELDPKGFSFPKKTYSHNSSLKKIQQVVYRKKVCLEFRQYSGEDEIGLELSQNIIEIRAVSAKTPAWETPVKESELGRYEFQLLESGSNEEAYRVYHFEAQPQPAQQDGFSEGVRKDDGRIRVTYSRGSAKIEKIEGDLSKLPVERLLNRSHLNRISIEKGLAAPGIGKALAGFYKGIGDKDFVVFEKERHSILDSILMWREAQRTDDQPAKNLSYGEWGHMLKNLSWGVILVTVGLAFSKMGESIYKKLDNLVFYQQPLFILIPIILLCWITEKVDKITRLEASQNDAHESRGDAGYDRKLKGFYQLNRGMLWAAFIFAVVAGLVVLQLRPVFSGFTEYLGINAGTTFLILGLAVGFLSTLSSTLMGRVWWKFLEDLVRNNERLIHKGYQKNFFIYLYIGTAINVALIALPIALFFFYYSFGLTTPYFGNTPLGYILSATAIAVAAFSYFLLPVFGRFEGDGKMVIKVPEESFLIEKEEWQGSGETRVFQRRWIRFSNGLLLSTDKQDCLPVIYGKNKFIILEPEKNGVKIVTGQPPAVPTVPHVAPAPTATASLFGVGYVGWFARGALEFFSRLTGPALLTFFGIGILAGGLFLARNLSPEFVQSVSALFSNLDKRYLAYGMFGAGLAVMAALEVRGKRPSAVLDIIRNVLERYEKAGKRFTKDEFVESVRKAVKDAGIKDMPHLSDPTIKRYMAGHPELLKLYKSIKIKKQKSPDAINEQLLKSLEGNQCKLKKVNETIKIQAAKGIARQLKKLPGQGRPDVTPKHIEFALNVYKFIKAQQGQAKKDAKDEKGPVGAAGANISAALRAEKLLHELGFIIMVTKRKELKAVLEEELKSYMDKLHSVMPTKRTPVRPESDTEEARRENNKQSQSPEGDDDSLWRMPRSGALRDLAEETPDVGDYDKSFDIDESDDTVSGGMIPALSDLLENRGIKLKHQWWIEQALFLAGRVGLVAIPALGYYLPAVFTGAVFFALHFTARKNMPNAPPMQKLTPAILAIINTLSLMWLYTAPVPSLLIYLIVSLLHYRINLGYLRFISGITAPQPPAGKAEEVMIKNLIIIEVHPSNHGDSATTVENALKEKGLLDEGVALQKYILVFPLLLPEEFKSLQKIGFTGEELDIDGFLTKTITLPGNFTVVYSDAGRITPDALEELFQARKEVDIVVLGGGIDHCYRIAVMDLISGVVRSKNKDRSVRLNLYLPGADLTYPKDMEPYDINGDLLYLLRFHNLTSEVYYNGELKGPGNQNPDVTLHYVSDKNNLIKAISAIPSAPAAAPAQPEIKIGAKPRGLPSQKPLAQWSPFDDMSITTSGGHNLGTPEEEMAQAEKGDGPESALPAASWARQSHSSVSSRRQMTAQLLRESPRTIKELADLCKVPYAIIYSDLATLELRTLRDRIIRIKKSQQEKARQRRQRIKELLQEGPRTIRELADLCEVSAPIIRKDLSTPELNTLRDTIIRIKMPQEEKGHQRRQRIKELLQEGPRTIKELADLCKVPYAIIYSDLATLELRTLKDKIVTIQEKARQRREEKLPPETVVRRKFVFLTGTHYKILGIPFSADADTIEGAFRRLIKRWHPDKGGAIEETKRIIRAWRCLRDPARRAKYDRWIKTAFRRVGLDEIEKILSGMSRYQPALGKRVIESSREEAGERLNIDLIFIDILLEELNTYLDGKGLTTFAFKVEKEISGPESGIPPSEKPRPGEELQRRMTGDERIDDAEQARLSQARQKVKNEARRKADEASNADRVAPEELSQKEVFYSDHDFEKAGWGSNIADGELRILESGSRIISESAKDHPNKIDPVEKVIKLGEGGIIATDSGYRLSTGKDVLAGCLTVIIQAYIRGKPCAYAATHVNAYNVLRKQVDETLIQKAVDCLNQLVPKDALVRYQAMVFGGKVFGKGRQAADAIRDDLIRKWNIDVPLNCYYLRQWNIDLMAAFYDGRNKCRLENLKLVTPMNEPSARYRLDSVVDLTWPPAPEELKNGPTLGAARRGDSSVFGRPPDENSEAVLLKPWNKACVKGQLTPDEIISNLDSSRNLLWASIRDNPEAREEFRKRCEVLFKHNLIGLLKDELIRLNEEGAVKANLEDIANIDVVLFGDWFWRPENDSSRDLDILVIFRGQGNYQGVLSLPWGIPSGAVDFCNLEDFKKKASLTKRLALLLLGSGAVVYGGNLVSEIEFDQIQTEDILNWAKNLIKAGNLEGDLGELGVPRKQWKRYWEALLYCQRFLPARDAEKTGLFLQKYFTQPGISPTEVLRNFFTRYYLGKIEVLPWLLPDSNVLLQEFGTLVDGSVNTLEQNCLKIESRRFPDGELYLRILNPDAASGARVNLTYSIESCEDVVRIVLLADTLKRYGALDTNFILDKPYDAANGLIEVMKGNYRDKVSDKEKKTPPLWVNRVLYHRARFKNDAQEAAGGINAACDRIKIIKDTQNPSGWRVILPDGLTGQNVVLVHATENNVDIVELWLMLVALRRAGVNSISLINTYEGYSRQDKAFKAGEAVSSNAMLKVIDAYADNHLALNVHYGKHSGWIEFQSHRLYNLNAFVQIAEKLFDKVADTVGADNLAAELAEHPLILVAPDDGASDYIAEATEVLHNYVKDKYGIDIQIDSGYLDKTRVSATEVKITGLILGKDKTMVRDPGELSGHWVFIIDDETSHGSTLLASTYFLVRKLGVSWKRILAGVVHGKLARGLRPFNTGLNEEELKIATEPKPEFIDEEKGSMPPQLIAATQSVSLIPDFPEHWKVPISKIISFAVKHIVGKGNEGNNDNGGQSKDTPPGNTPAGEEEMARQKATAESAEAERKIVRSFAEAVSFKDWDDVGTQKALLRTALREKGLLDEDGLVRDISEIRSTFFENIFKRFGKKTLGSLYNFYQTLHRSGELKIPEGIRLYQYILYHLGFIRENIWDELKRQRARYINYGTYSDKKEVDLTAPTEDEKLSLVRKGNREAVEWFVQQYTAVIERELKRRIGKSYEGNFRFDEAELIGIGEKSVRRTVCRYASNAKYKLPLAVMIGKNIRRDLWDLVKLRAGLRRKGGPGHSTLVSYDKPITTDGETGLLALLEGKAAPKIRLDSEIAGLLINLIKKIKTSKEPSLNERNHNILFSIFGINPESGEIQDPEGQSDMAKKNNITKGRVSQLRAQFLEWLFIDKEGRRFIELLGIDPGLERLPPIKKDLADPEEGISTIDDQMLDIRGANSRKYKNIVFEIYTDATGRIKHYGIRTPSYIAQKVRIYRSFDEGRGRSIITIEALVKGRVGRLEYTFVPDKSKGRNKLLLCVSPRDAINDIKNQLKDLEECNKEGKYERVDFETSTNAFGGLWLMEVKDKNGEVFVPSFLTGLRQKGAVRVERFYSKRLGYYVFKTERYDRHGRRVVTTSRIVYDKKRGVNKFERFNLETAALFSPGPESKGTTPAGEGETGLSTAKPSATPAPAGETAGTLSKSISDVSPEGTGPATEASAGKLGSDLKTSLRSAGPGPEEPMSFLRDIVNEKELSQNILEEILSYLFSGKKLVLAFNSELSGLSLPQLKVIVKKLNDWKEATARKNPKMKKILDNFTVFTYSSFEELDGKLNKAGFAGEERAKKENLIFTFTPKPVAAENPRKLGSSVRVVYLNEKRKFSESDYYPLLEVVTLSLAKNLLGWTIEEMEEMLQKNGVDCKRIGIDNIAKDDDDPAIPIFELLPAIERYELNERVDRYTRILREIYSSA